MNYLKLKYKLKAIFTPMCWTRLYPYNEEWDNWLWNSLEQGTEIVVGNCSSKVNGIELWHANYPYASGHSYEEPDDKASAQCSRATALFLNDELKTAYMIQRLKGPYDRFEFRKKYGIGFPDSFPYYL